MLTKRSVIMYKHSCTYVAQYNIMDQSLFFSPLYILIHYEIAVNQ